jgi:hypothetical protein
LQSKRHAASVGGVNESGFTMRIAFLHTAEVHVATFDRLFDAIDVDVKLDHHVDADLLARARQFGQDSVRSDVQAILKKLAHADAVLCTCSTLGPLADEAAQTFENILRIDRPLMEKACAEGQKILIALCLESTRDATLDLLRDCAEKRNEQVESVVVLCDKAWSYFEAGDTEAYAASIAEAIKSELAEQPDVDCIVLAQASMRVAEAELAQIGIPVLSSPEIAARRCIEIARQIVTKKAPTR